jgi:hypothetical protein
VLSSLLGGCRLGGNQHLTKIPATNLPSTSHFLTRPLPLLNSQLAMKFPLSILSLILTLSVATQGRNLPRNLKFFSGSTQASLNEIGEADDLDVPGDSPLKYCKDPADDILVIDHVDLDPNPPKA